MTYSNAILLLEVETRGNCSVLSKLHFEASCTSTSSMSEKDNEYYSAVSSLQTSNMSSVETNYVSAMHVEAGNSR